MRSAGSRSSGTCRKSPQHPRSAFRPHRSLPSRTMSERWLDLVQPSRSEVEAALPSGADPDVLEALAASAVGGREPRPLIEDHGAYVFGVLVPIVTLEASSTHQEICFVATADRLLTVRKGTTNGASFDVGSLHAAVHAGSSVGMLVHRLVDDVVDTYLDLL